MTKFVVIALPVGIVACSLLLCFLVLTQQPQARGASWADPSRWQEQDCEVLALGVSCTDMATGGTCDSLPIKSDKPSSTPVFFTYEHRASCPGSYYCAGEGEGCLCDGEVLYAPEAFNGVEFVYQDVVSEYRLQSYGDNLVCGTDSMGVAFLKDPAPNKRKHCWCTPRKLMNLVNEKYILGSGKEECTREANVDFALADDIAGQRVDPKARRLTKSPMLTYTPWALVSLGTDSSAQKSAGGQPIGSVACAFAKGATLASYGDFRSEGTSAAKQAEAMASSWRQTNKCWVHKTGRSSGCAVSMALPAASAQVFDAKWIVIIILCGLCAGWLFLLYRQQWEANAGSPSDPAVASRPRSTGVSPRSEQARGFVRQPQAEE